MLSVGKDNEEHMAQALIRVVTLEIGGLSLVLEKIGATIQKRVSN